jgi:hypothetical protein
MKIESICENGEWMGNDGRGVGIEKELSIEIVGMWLKDGDDGRAGGDGECVLIVGGDDGGLRDVSWKCRCLALLTWWSTAMQVLMIGEAREVDLEGIKLFRTVSARIVKNALSPIGMKVNK